MDIFIRISANGRLVGIDRTLNGIRGDDDAVNIGNRDEWNVGGDKVYRRRLYMTTVEFVLVEARERGIANAQAAINQFFGE